MHVPAASRSTNLKILITVVGVLVVGYVASAPYLTAYQLQRAIVEQDREALGEYVDFPSLRESLKGELNAVMVREMPGEGGAFAALGVALIGVVTDRMIDAYVTPAGLRALMTDPGKQVELSRDAPAVLSGTSTLSDRLDMDIEMGYRNLGRFDIVATSKGTGDQVSFVLRRSGIGWKLAEVRLPQG